MQTHVLAIQKQTCFADRVRDFGFKSEASHSKNASLLPSPLRTLATQRLGVLDSDRLLR